MVQLLVNPVFGMFESIGDNELLINLIRSESDLVKPLILRARKGDWPVDAANKRV